MGTYKITEKNFYRYRSYYYDEETGSYYLKARYYAPEIRRFISADSMNAIMVAATDVTCKNLFVYAENNPVTNKDSSGNFVETVFDVTSLANSIEEVYKNPTDPLAWACMVGDAADLMIPCVAGIGEGIRGAKKVAKIADKADEVSDVAKATLKSNDVPKVHGNSKLSTKPQHGYEIYNTETGDVVKTGISGQKLNLNGTSPRANSQVNKLNTSIGTQYMMLELL